VNRRGSAQDVLFIAVLLFASAIGFLVIYYATNSIYTALLANAQIQESDAAIEALQAGKDNLAKLDTFFLAVFIGLVLSLIITSWFISGNPLFMGIYIVIMVIAVVVSMALSNAWESVSQNATFASSMSALPTANHVLTYLPYYISVVAMIGLIVIFAKPAFAPGGDLPS
jgi:hypothetical protein